MSTTIAVLLGACFGLQSQTAALKESYTSPAPVGAVHECAMLPSPSGRPAWELLELLDLSAIDTGEAALTVVLAPHAVRHTNGSGGIADAALAQALADARRAFAPGAIDLRSLPLDEIWDDDFVQIDDYGELYALKQVHKVPNAINVYFVESLLGGNYYGISSYSYFPEDEQGIVVINSAAGSVRNPSTFPHEIGHYFDLFHTYDQAGLSECSLDAFCRSSGDLVCDTPPEPSFLTAAELLGYPACLYIGGALQPCPGSPAYEPDLTNFMSRGGPPCRDHFTAGQLERARATLLLLRPELVIGGWPPSDWQARATVPQ